PAKDSDSGAAVPARPEFETARSQQEAPPSAAERRPAPAASSLAGPAEFKLPELGENIDQGDLVRLMIAPGAKVSEGQPVMELETDKAVVEVPSSVSGLVKEVRVKEGDKVKVGQFSFPRQGAPAAQPVKAASEPVEHVSGQQAARLAFHLAIKAEGKTEEQALPPDQPVPVPPPFTMPVQLGKVAGTE